MFFPYENQFSHLEKTIAVLPVFQIFNTKGDISKNLFYLSLFRFNGWFYFYNKTYKGKVTSVFMIGFVFRGL